MTLVQEIRIAAIQGLNVPEGLAEGSQLSVTCELIVSSVEQEWVDVTTVVGKPEHLPGNLTLGCVAVEWSAA